ncbi:hypothetical protein OUZ56_011500 [Daphnia magna]|uniref:Retrotransposon gag domain-containing protein n=1 Tax=Daphnia magna TaxID=35525 RepID=A0ABQ9Z0C1_9CRUS|nr:hypothetical protein OUZ56_011500 [Daphnia magna]
MEATGNLPNAWSDVQWPPVVRGVKSTLLTQFTPINYVQHNEAKLLARKQGIEESTLEYYYDVLDLCRRPTNCDEFLQELKRFQEMTDRGKQDKWALRVMGREKRPTYDPSQQDATVETWFGKIKRMLGVIRREEKPTYDPSQQDATKKSSVKAAGDREGEAEVRLGQAGDPISGDERHSWKFFDGGNG